ALHNGQQVIVKTPSQPTTVSFLLSELLQIGDLPRAPILLSLPDEITKVKIFNYLTTWLTRAKMPLKTDQGYAYIAGKELRRQIHIFARLTPLALTVLKQNERSLFLLSSEDLANTLPAPDAFAKQIIKIKTNGAIKRSKLISQLIDNGYDLERTCNQTGLVASRGGVIDIWPPDSERAFRLDLEGDTIESIKSFVPGNKQTINVDEVNIIPFKIDHLQGNKSLLDYNSRLKTITIEPFPTHFDAAVPFSFDETNRLNAIIAPPRIKTDAKQDFSFIRKLRPGDLVVHADHGLARFDGIGEQTIDDIPAEYFKLLYAEGDKLFVPVTLAEKIEKYIGETNPTLNRLSGTSWQKAVEKVRADTLAEARELLNTHARRELGSAPVIPRQPKVEDQLKKTFPYQETADQNRAITSVYADLAKTEPMDRLVCGDVGFGKTEVAIRAAAKTALSGYQTVILSPTTILAQQHIDTFTERLQDLPVVIRGLSRFESKKDQQQIIAGLTAGKIDIVIGTHRLLSKDIVFKNLGLIIIDEEQRFGVEHKETLKRLRSVAHILTLSATPIPRTLHLSLSGVRDISTINTAPAGRLPIDTHIEPHNHTKIKEILEHEIKRSGQAYYLYNNIETIELKKRELENLLPQARFGILHGQLPETEVAQVMHKFDKRELDILISTTIIENGLDLPNVNTLVVDNAVQFGLSQLHQIRGRIGRGDRQAYAYFFYQRQKLTGEAEKRLEALEEAKALGSGFDLAMRDMEIRGVGNILGKAQHGHVASVGLGMYLRLLRQAVEEIESGERVEVMPHIAVDLPIEARIPVFFENDKEKRIEYYHQWALIDDLDELDQVKKKLETEGALPKALENLFAVFRLKIIGRAAGISAINTQLGSSANNEQMIVVKPNQPIVPKLFAKLLDIAPSWYYATDEIKIPKKDLGEYWLAKLDKCLRLLLPQMED
ncbi:MAG: CarD family transcriptional regulator, partial [Candidatus Komeilibacteria bacterium]|nr:CarD family transcriptional regulator [Candidatus Komeilibacteria bacterium]